MIHIFSFILLSIFLVLLPGPDYIIITKNTLNSGRTAGLKTLFGTCIALCIHTLIAIFGLSAIIVHSIYLFTIFKFTGAGYLLYLGIISLLSIRKNKKSDTYKPIKPIGKSFYFRQGFFTNLLNPKVAVFFLTFLPQFVNPNHSTFIPFILLGLIYIVITLGFFLVYTLMIHQLNHFMQKESTQKAIQGFSGVVLIGFGIKLALEKGQ
ncbi:LysE family translocator [Terrilactibacillus laevilacticus]|uniref:LysE family translocator n=1 Tax=Terrilactibacillus laevilacticus TaxID=1380157 RepID=UPI0011471772|nr:LysE family translocator [Terrilactibacillus laevilacticus]